jgi:hypothetical protein
MKTTVRLQIATGLVMLCSTAALTVRADPDSYEGRRVRGVDTENGERSKHVTERLLSTPRMVAPCKLDAAVKP